MAKLEEIIDFAEIEEAIDAPVRTYSSGMQVRLGFAVAVILFNQMCLYSMRFWLLVMSGLSSNV